LKTGGMDIGTLRLIIDVALAIEKAAENVEQNKKDCEEMRSNVALVRTNLMRLENNEPLMMDPAVSPTVAAIGEILREAQELVEDCKVKRNVVELLFTAGKLSKKLKETRNRILFNTIILMCAITVRQECRRPTQEVNQLGLHCSTYQCDLYIYPRAILYLWYSYT
jgi:hypothetical protein